MKRIWFTQQKPFNYYPLRCGLGLISQGEFELYQSLTPDPIIAKDTGLDVSPMRRLCPKLFTTRTRPMRGEYVVVEGSRYHAKPVTPEIRFQVKSNWELDLRTGRVASIISEVDINRIFKHGAYEGEPGDKWWFDANEYLTAFLNLKYYIKNKPDIPFTFPELDLGIKGSIFSGLKDVLLRLNKKATLGTPFYVNLLEPLGRATS